MEFVRISRENGLWDKLWADWDKICSSFGEDFQDFAPSSLTVLRPLAESPQTASAGVFALINEGSTLAVCQLNVAFIKGYDNQVLRLRHLLLSPEYDFSDDVTVDKYVEILSEMFAGTVLCAQNELPASHVKLHLQSPADREFFKEIGQHLTKAATFSSVKMRGAWLYIDL
ncbi:MAG: hypothetical protein KAT26_09760 [Marinosulfonomonas sp.]|nr:hypothetical protein [Marinosulfonomonas sp.]